MKYAEVNRSMNFSLLRLVGYYVQRLVTQPFLRSIVIHSLRRVVGMRNLPWARSDPKQKEVLLKLRADGIVSLGQLFTDEQCAEILQFLKDKQLSHKSYPGKVFSAATRPAHVGLGDYSLPDLVHCPHVLAVVNHIDLIELAREYLGCAPTVSGLSARWSFPSESSEEVVQQFHRDSEDWKAFRIMVYLTDVSENSGPHVYIKGTHLDQRGIRLKIHSNGEIIRSFRPERVVRQTGAKGCGFAVDTSGIHKGEVPKDSPRLLLSFQYSMFPCFLYEYEPVAVDHFPYDPYINRLIVEPRLSMDVSKK